MGASGLNNVQLGPLEQSVHLRCTDCFALCMDIRWCREAQYSVCRRRISHAAVQPAVSPVGWYSRSVGTALVDDQVMQTVICLLSPR